MLKERKALVRSVADNLFAAEDTTDQTLKTVNTLMNVLLQGRQEINMAAEVGHEALTHLSSAQRAAMELRTHLVAAHQQLAADKIRIGAREIATGPIADKPPPGFAPFFTGAELRESA